MLAAAAAAASTSAPDAEEAAARRRRRESLFDAATAMISKGFPIKTSVYLYDTAPVTLSTSVTNDVCVFVESGFQPSALMNTLRVP